MLAVPVRSTEAEVPRVQSCELERHALCTFTEGCEVATDGAKRGVHHERSEPRGDAKPRPRWILDAERSDEAWYDVLYARLGGAGVDGRHWFASLHPLSRLKRDATEGRPEYRGDEHKQNGAQSP